MSHFDAEALVARIDAAASQARQLSRRTLLKQGAALGAGLAGFSAFQHSVAATASNRLRAANILAQSGELAAEQVVRLPEGEPIVFDPGVTSGGKGLEMIQNLFEGLVFIDQRDGSLQMGVAETMDVNDEQTEFTFTVRDGVTWSDGTPLNCQRLRVELEARARPGDQVRIHHGALSDQECGRDRLGRDGPRQSLA